MSKRFINGTADIVSDLMGGLSLDSSRATLLDPAVGHNVAIRASLAANTQTPRVSVVSGGGSGHEPMAGGYVGEGMLAAAVAGGIFSSPSVSAISAMLEAVAPRSKAILVVVMNYQGDRLNFGLAVKELLKKSPGYDIHVTIVNDDVALPTAKEKRGIAGTIFVLKVAGAAADQGKSFREVVYIAETAARSIVSFGVALEPCTIPGQAADTERIPADEVELGMGIHGEHGIERMKLSQLNRGNLTHDLVFIVCSRLDQAMHESDVASLSTGLAVMINNLGAVPHAEMLIVAKEVSDFIYHADAGVLNGNIRRVHLFVGTFMTSLQMNGISVSCLMLPTDKGIMEQLLHSSTVCMAWNPGFELFSPSHRSIVPRLGDQVHTQHCRTSPVSNVHFSFDSPLPHMQHQSRPNHEHLHSAPKPTVHAEIRSSKQHSTSKGAPKVYAGGKANTRATGNNTGLSRSTEMYILTITSALQSQCDDLTELDLSTGDGDFGDTVKRGCSKIRDDLQNGRYAYAANNPSKLYRAIARSTEVMGGTSGGFTGLFLHAAADKLENLQMQHDYDSERAWRAAFVAGTKAVMAHGKADVGDRTLVDALKPAADIFEHGSGSLADAAHAARIGVESTKSITNPKFGRSTHARPEKLLNKADPGALAIFIILDSLVDAPRVP